MNTMLENLKGQLIVSCQAYPGEPPQFAVRDWLTLQPSKVKWKSR